MPFKDAEGPSYLGPRHIDGLAYDGVDNVCDVVVLDPICCQKMHIGKDKQDVAKLKGSIEAAIENLLRT